MNAELFTRVCSTPGVPGFEDAAQAVAKEVLGSTCDDLKTDYMGNVIAIKKAANPPAGKRPFRLALAGHVDEIGFMAKHIDGNGYVHFIQLGGQHPQTCESQRVIIHGYGGDVRGVIVPKTFGDGPIAKLKDLLVDTGLPADDLKKLVRPGDVISFDADVSRLNGKMWVGRNFDNRVGNYCLLQAMKEVGDTQVDVYAISSVQEEMGLRGMHAASNPLEADIGLAIDGSMTRGAYVDDKDNLCEPGKGTGIYVIDNLTIGHPKLVQYLCDLSEARGIAYQRNIGGGTDAKAMQQSSGGVIATTIGAPVRYMHSTVQLCHEDDIDATVALLVAFMETAHDFMDSL